MTDSVSRQQVPVPLHYRHADRAQVLATLIHNLVVGQPDPGLPGLPLTTKSLTDPTVALLDCWATVADVIDFYQERIATEGFLDTATEPESVLALATLVGYRPRPGLAASCWLAYTLVVDPTDTAVLLPKGQLVQSIPAAGQLPQTFESSEDLVARPSWNTLQVKDTAPVVFDLASATYPDLVLSGATSPLTPNDVVLIRLASLSKPRIVRVASVTADFIANTTTVALQPPVSPVQAAAAPDDRAPSDIMLEKAQNLFDPLTSAPSVPPPTGTRIPRDPDTLFPLASDEAGTRPELSDTRIKILAALQPGLSKALYPALATSTIGAPQVESAQGLLISSAPFGVQIPPQPRFDRNGQPQPAEEWPIEDTQSYRIVFDGDTTPYTFAGAAIHVESSAGKGNSTITSGAPTPPTIDHTSITIDANQTTITFGQASPTNSTGGTGDNGAAAIEPITVAISDHTVKVTLTPSGGNVPVPVSVSLDDAITAADAAANLPAPSDANLGLLVRIEFLPTPPRALIAAVGGQTTSQFIVDIVSALPLSDPKTLDLNEKRDEILAGSYVVIDSAPPQPAKPDFSYPVIAQVVSATPVAVNRYGMSPTVTRLVLDSDWVSPHARLLSDLRPLTVYAQSVDLDLQPVPVATPVSGSTIDVEGLHPGIEIGHRLVITGTRADLPDGTVQAGETIMVSGVTQTPSAGDSPYTTLSLPKPGLSYQYQRSTVTLYGNVVPAHHGQTITETLSPTGDPANPTFTLAQAPVLADPSGGPAGFTSTLTLVIDGRTWAWVPRLDTNTPPFSYITGTDGQGHTTITLGQPLPYPASVAVATYRAGAGGAGNLAAGQLSQPLTRPLALATVTNPLPASGGANPDGPDVVRANAPRGLQALGRVVSVQDAADLALSWAGIGKTAAALTTDGGSEIVQVTVAGVSPSPLDPSSALITDLGAALTAAGDVTVPIRVTPAPLNLIVLVAQIHRDPDISWDTVEPAVRAELTDAYGYARRGLNEDIVISDLIAVIHRVDAVRSCTITGLGLIGANAQPKDVAAFVPGPPDSPIPVAGGQPIAVTDGHIPVTGVAYITDTVADTVMLADQQEV